MAEHLVKAPWVHVKGANSNTRQMINDARQKMPVGLDLGVAYIRGKATGSGDRVTTIWRNGDSHRSFGRDMSAEVHFRPRAQEELPF